jgi:hypothetical protein
MGHTTTMRQLALLVALVAYRAAAQPATSTNLEQPDDDLAGRGQSLASVYEFQHSGGEQSVHSSKMRQAAEDN